MKNAPYQRSLTIFAIAERNFGGRREVLPVGVAYVGPHLYAGVVLLDPHLYVGVVSVKPHLYGMVFTNHTHFSGVCVKIKYTSDSLHILLWWVVSANFVCNLYYNPVT